MKYIIITLSGLLLSASLYAIALKNEIKAIKTELGYCKKNTELLQDSINKQNNALRELQADTQNYKENLSDFNANLNAKYQIKGEDELERVNLLLEKFLSE